MPMLTQENPFQLGPFVDGEFFPEFYSFLT